MLGGADRLVGALGIPSAPAAAALARELAPVATTLADAVVAGAADGGTGGGAGMDGEPKIGMKQEPLIIKLPYNSIIHGCNY